MIRCLFVAAALLISSIAVCGTDEFSSSRLEKFQKLLSTDTNEVEKHLAEWGATNPDDPELAVAWSNYYFSQALRPVSLYSTPKDYKVPREDRGKVFALVSTGTLETVGVIDTRERYADDLLTAAVTVLRDALTSHPRRMDMWMGMAHVQIKGSDWDGAYDTLTSMVAQIEREPKELQWAFGKPVEESTKEFGPEKLHAYVRRGHEAETTAGLEFTKCVALLAIQKYPAHPYAYNDLAAYYTVTEQNEQALRYLLEAHARAPEDALIMLNLATLYLRLGKKEKAREFLELAAEKADDDELRKDALDTLKEMERD